MTRATFTSFQESTKEEWAEIMVCLQETQSHVADRVLEQLRYLESDFGGFPVNRLEHCLQTATRAERDGRGEEYVLCALIHDIGDNLAPFNHPEIAAGILKPVVSEKHWWMTKNHGIFQGYYFWHYIGLDRNARDQFMGHEWFDYTAEFCELYDSVAFDPTYESFDLAHFEPLVRDAFKPKVR
ncbi:MAG: HD domain-containing protein [Ilumatobacteraceae bacterium]